MSTPRIVRSSDLPTPKRASLGQGHADQRSLDLAVSPGDSSVPPSSHRLIGGIILAVIVGLVFAASNLPMEYVETNAEWVGMIEFAMIPGQAGDVMPTMSGWPLRYHVQMNRDDAVELRYWSWARLLGNVIIGASLMAGIVTLAWMRSTWIERSANPVRAKKRFEVAFAIGMIALPLLLLAPIVIQSRAQDRLVQQLSRRGNVLRSSWLPAPLADQVPSGLVRLTRRIRRVQLAEIDDSIAAAVFDLDELMQFDSMSGKFDTKLLNRLSGHVHLTKLTLARHQVGRQEFDAIDRLPWLKDLSLPQSRIDPSEFTRLQSIKGLESVNLAMSNLPLSEIGTPDWSATVRSMMLSRPRDGQTGSLTIEGWPHLNSLNVMQSDRGPNRAELRIKLADLPQLERLSIDPLQLHALDLKNLPRLSYINHDAAQVLFPSSDGMWLPAMDWYSELVLENLPALARASCFAPDLTKLRLRKVPNLQELQVGAYVSSSFGGSLTQPIDVNQCKQWIAEIGQLDGPKRLLLAALPLHGIDLQPIVDNVGIRDLQLDETGIEFSDVQRLATMRQLTSLSLGECEIREDQMDWFLAQFPDLEVLKINGGRLRTIHLQGDQNGGNRLRRIEVSQLREIESLRIVDRPQLSAALRIECPIQELVLKNARSVVGLAMTEPWPANASVTGFRDLRWFAAGGPHVDDELLEVLLRCPALDQLTLAYSSISRDRFRRLGELSHLTVMIIPGADVDDDITSNWSRLGSLWEINLDGSRVGIKTIAWLSGIESLRSVSLNRVPLDAAARATLRELRQVTALRLRNCPLTTADALRLLDAESLEILDLSGCDIDAAAVIERASQLGGLKGLVLQGATVDESVLKKAFAVNDTLAVDVSVTGPAAQSQVATVLTPGSPTPADPIVSNSLIRNIVTSDADDEIGVNNPGNGTIQLLESMDEEFSEEVVEVLRQAAPTQYSSATRTEMARRMSRFRLAVRRAQGTSMRNQSHDPALSTMMSHEEISLEELQSRRTSKEYADARSLQIFATTLDSGRIDLDRLRHAANSATVKPESELSAAVTPETVTAETVPPETVTPETVPPESAQTLATEVPSSE